MTSPPQVATAPVAVPGRLSLRQVVGRLRHGIDLGVALDVLAAPEPPHLRYALARSARRH